MKSVAGGSDDDDGAEDEDEEGGGSVAEDGDRNGFHAVRIGLLSNPFNVDSGSSPRYPIVEEP